MTAAGRRVGAIDVLRDGLVGRGVLLDIPRLRGVPWLEPGEHVFPEDLEAAEREQGVRVGPGDILLVRTGHARRRAELPPWDTRIAKSGLHPTTALLPGRALRRGARLRRQQRHRPEHDRGRRLPDPRARAQRDGRSTCSTTSSSRTSPGSARPRGAGSSCSPPRRCGSCAEPDPRSTRPRSSRADAPSQGLRSFAARWRRSVSELERRRRGAARGARPGGARRARRC